MSTNNTAPAPAPKQSQQIIIPIGKASDGSTALGRIYFDDGIQKSHVTAMRVYLESVEQILS